MLIQLPTVGSVLFTGPDQSWQSVLVRQLAADALLNGATLIYLTDFEVEGREAEAALGDLLRAKGAAADALERYAYVPKVRQYPVSDDLQTRIERTRRMSRKPLVIVRDLGCALLELLPGASWLDEADELALLMDGLVLTAGHYGPEAKPAPDPLHYRADQVWTCSAGANLGLTLRRHKPTESTVKLRGHVHPYGIIAFANEMETV
jgi:hypothetical protein